MDAAGGGGRGAGAGPREEGELKTGGGGGDAGAGAGAREAVGGAGAGTRDEAELFPEEPRGQSQKGTFISDALEKQPSVKKAALAAARAAAPEPALEKKASSGSVPKVSPRVDAGVEAPGTTEAKELEELKRSSSMKDNPFMRRD